MTADQQSGGGYPLDNLTYDLLTVIHEKSQALEAYDKYQRDAEGDQEIAQLFQQIRRQDEQVIGQLVQHLSRRLGGQGGASSSDDQSGGDRKSTRLNSSHANISYAVFCLKKKKK